MEEKKILYVVHHAEGGLCKMHKTNRTQRKKDYYGNNIIENIKERLECGEEFDLLEYRLKNIKYINSIIFISKQIVGIDIFIGDIDERTAFEKYDPIFNKHVYDKRTN